MTCSICRTEGHTRKGHYPPCGVCKKPVFFYRMTLIPEKVRCNTCPQ